ncbi:hypothetical protein ABK040_013800 [Willaertia magna]
MEHFLMKASHLMQNGEWEKVKALVKPIMEQHPRIQMVHTSLNIFASSISGETSIREKALEEISETENVYKKIKKSEIPKLINVIKDLNQQIKNEGNEYYLSEERKDKNFVELEELNQEQLNKNFTLDFDLLDAELHLWRGILQFHAGSYIKGFYNMRKSYVQYKEIYQVILQNVNESKESNNFIHSDLIHNVEYGIGVFNFMLGILPPALTKILSLVGFDSNRDEGLVLLRKVFNYGGRNKSNACFMLCLNYLFTPRALVDKEKNLNEVQPIIESILKIYPTSSLLLFMSSHYERKRGNIEKSIKDLVESVNTCKNSIGIKPFNYLFDLAINYILLFDWDNASKILIELVNSKEEFDTRGVSAMMLSVCYAKLNDNDNALNIINSLDKYVSKNSRIDKFAIEKIDLLKHIKTNDEKQLIMLLSTFQLLYLRRDLANLNNEHATPLSTYFDEIVDKVQIDDKSKVAGDIKSGIAVVQGQLLKSIDKLEDSRKAFESALLQEGKTKYEKQWIAFAYYEIGEAIYMEDIKDKELEKQKKHSLLLDVKKYFDKCSKISGYPFEEVLHSRVKLAIKQVEAEIQQSK